MTVTLHHELADFWSCAEPLYTADPVRNNVALIAVNSRTPADTKPELLATVQRNGGTRSAVLAVGSRSALLSALDTADVAELVDALVTRGTALPYCFGPADVADEFAAAWSARAEQEIRERFPQLLYELGELREPTGVPGSARLATMDDVPAVSDMIRGFAEAIPAVLTSAMWTEQAVRGIRAGSVMLWERDGEAVAQALARQPAYQVSRISYVYTREQHRGHGYAAAVSAATSRLARDLGALHVVLHTDKANPTSNGVYQRIGYRVVSEMTEYTFQPPQ